MQLQIFLKDSCNDNPTGQHLTGAGRLTGFEAGESVKIDDTSMIILD